MPLPLPLLDRRTWAELVAEARALLPRYAHDWTDYNEHDPGITLVELFAWLSELLMFRSDRIPPAELRAFLRWFGVTPAPAQAATTVLALELPPVGVPQAIGAGMKIADPTSGLVFETDEPLRVSPAWIELVDEGTTRGRIFSRAGGLFTDLSAGNGRAGFEFAPLGPAPVPGDALWMGFDCPPAAPGEELSLQFWTAAWSGDPDVRARLIAAEQEPSPCSTRWFEHYSARLAWEGWDGAQWQPLDVVTDQTRALTLTGPVRLVLGTLAQDPPAAPDPGYWWLRCRLASGGYECPPRLAAIAVNAVAARHEATIAGPEALGISRGHAHEVYQLAGRIVEQGAEAVAQPMLAGKLRLRLVGPTGLPDDSWNEVPNWDRTGAFDRHYVVQPATNTVRFGDGRIGRVPPPGSAVEAVSYRVGGGPAGNLPAGRLTQILAGAPGPLAVRQPFAAIGGRAVESLDQAHGRALGLIGVPARAITVADWEALALDVPGVPVGRARALAGVHPDFPCWSAPGVVTVVVLPECGDRPTPGPDFLAAVTRHLHRRRPVTTELHVVGPRYVAVTVSATLHLAEPSPGVAARAQGAVDAFFDPLHGGPVGSGWPFGRGVLESDLLDLLGRLPGVAYIEELRIATDGGPPRCQNLALCRTDLVDSQAHHFVVVEA